MGKRWFGNAFIYLIIFVAVIALFFTLFSSNSAAEKINLPTVLAMARTEQISKILVDGDRLLITPRTSPDRIMSASTMPGTDILEILLSAGIDPVEKSIEIEYKTTGGISSVFGVLLQFLPLIFFGAILLFMMRQAQGTNNQTLSFGKAAPACSRATAPPRPSRTWPVSRSPRSSSNRSLSSSNTRSGSWPWAPASRKACS